MESEPHRQALAAGFPFARRHRFVGDEQIVQAAGPGEPHLVGGVEHARGIAEELPRAIERERLQKSLRRQSRPAAEQMVQLGRGDAGRFGDGLDLGLLAPMVADMADGAAHHVVIGRGGVKRCEIGDAIGRQHGCLH